MAEQRDDGCAGVAADNGDVLVGRVAALDLGDEAGCTDDVKSGHTEEALRVVDALRLEDLAGDGDCAVDGVGDDEDVRFWSGIGGGFGEVPDD